MPKTRVLVVDDSLTARKHLIEVLKADAEIEVAGEAEDGKKAIELCRALRPDVMTLDMMLPVMSGVAVTEYVMAYCPTPILVVSSSTNRGELYKTYDALAAGLWMCSRSHREMNLTDSGNVDFCLLSKLHPEFESSRTYGASSDSHR